MRVPVFTKTTKIQREETKRTKLVAGEEKRAKFWAALRRDGSGGGLRPTLANPFLACQFWPIHFWPKLEVSGFWPIHFWPIHFCVLRCVVLCVVCCVACCCFYGSCWWCGCWFGHPSAGHPSARHPSARHPSISLFLFPLPSPLRSFCLSLCVFSSNFGGVCEDRDPQMCTFGLSGCRVKPRRLRGRGFTRQLPVLQNTTKIPREDTQRETKRAKMEAGDEKKKKKKRAPTLRAPTLRGPHPSVPHHSGPHTFRGSHPSLPNFFWVWAPPFGAMTHTQIQMEWPK